LFYTIKMETIKSPKGITFISIVALVTIILSGYAYLRPSIVLESSLKTTEVMGFDIHLIDARIRRVVFYLNLKINNPNEISVNIEEIEANILFNGTDYHGQTLPGATGSVKPGMSVEFVRLVELDAHPLRHYMPFDPIGPLHLHHNQPLNFGTTDSQRFNLTITIEVKGSVTFLFLKAKKVHYLTENIMWKIDY